MTDTTAPTAQPAPATSLNSMAPATSLNSILSTTPQTRLGAAGHGADTENSTEHQTRNPDRRHVRLRKALDEARRDLVDPSRRNRLLHAPLDGKRPWCMAIVGHDADELFNAL